jgi:hypothetical protein
LEGKVYLQNSGRIAPREQERMFRPIDVIARSEATRQSILLRKERMDCFASLAMTVAGAHHPAQPVPAQPLNARQHPNSAAPSGDMG